MPRTSKRAPHGSYSCHSLLEMKTNLKQEGIEMKQKAKLLRSTRMRNQENSLRN